MERCARCSTSRRAASSTRSICASRSTARRRRTATSAARRRRCGSGKIGGHDVHVGAHRPRRGAAARRAVNARGRRRDGRSHRCRGSGSSAGTQSYVVVLQEKGGARLLPIWIGQPEAESIVMQMHNIKRARPLTHDLCKSLIVALGAIVRAWRSRTSRTTPISPSCTSSATEGRAGRRAAVRRDRHRAAPRRADLRRRSRCSMLPDDDEERRAMRTRTVDAGRRRAPARCVGAERGAVEGISRASASRGLRQVQLCDRSRSPAEAPIPTGGAAIAWRAARRARHARQDRLPVRVAVGDSCIASAPTAPARSTRCAPARTAATRFATGRAATRRRSISSSTSYGGIAYFTSPLRAAVVTGDDATLTVFDTTSAARADQGRRPAPHRRRAAGRTAQRPIVEVFDLQNDSTVTRDRARQRVAGLVDARPDGGGRTFEVNPSGDVAAGGDRRATARRSVCSCRSARASGSSRSRTICRRRAVSAVAAARARDAASSRCWSRSPRRACRARRSRSGAGERRGPRVPAVSRAGRAGEYGAPRRRAGHDRRRT